MSKDINKQDFDEGTLLKLSIFSEFFKEWLPVFIYHPTIKNLLIIDFFAGSGKDTKGEYGSTLLLLEKASDFCGQLKKKNKSITFIFNEYEPKRKQQEKYQELKQNVNKYVKECSSKNSYCNNECILNIKIENDTFNDLFDNEEIQIKLNSDDTAKFLLMDQYGVKHITDSIFKKLIDYPKTDFIFFIASSYIWRFGGTDEIKQYIDMHIDKEKDKYSEIHRLVFEFYQKKISNTKDYYSHRFSIQKGANYYGLIFGSGHTYGMEKFLEVCWKHDKVSGESNHSIDSDYDCDLFGNKTNNKIEDTKKELREFTLSGNITSNIEGFKYTMKKGCKPNLFAVVIKELIKANKIERYCNGANKLNYFNTKIHTLKRDNKEYFIRVL